MRMWLMRLKRPAAVGCVLGLLVGLYSLSLPNQYRSEARILPGGAKGLGGASSLLSAAASFGISLPTGEGADSNFVEILRSRWLRESLLNTTFSFRARRWRFGAERAYRETLAAYLDAGNMDRALVRMLSIMEVNRDLKSRVLTVAVETPSAELSQQIVQRSLQLLEEFVHRRDRTQGGAKATFAEARLKDARENLARAENELKAFQGRNRSYLNSSDPEVRIQGARIEAEYRLRQQLVGTLTASREQALLEEKNDIPIVDVLDPGNLPIDKSRPARVKIFLIGWFLGFLAAAVAENWAMLWKLIVDEDESPAHPA